MPSFRFLDWLPRLTDDLALQLRPSARDSCRDARKRAQEVEDSGLADYSLESLIAELDAEVAH